MRLEISTQPLLRKSRPAGTERRIASVKLTSQSTQLQRGFPWITGGLLILVLIRGYAHSPESVIGAIMIILAALLPSYLWVNRRASGMPIFPLYALTAIWIYAFPLVSDHPIVILFPRSAQLSAALSITGFLLLGTGIWYLLVRKAPKPVATCWMISDEQKDVGFVLVLGVIFVFTLAVGTGWLNAGIQIFSIVRAIMLAAEGLVCFILSYRLSQGKLDPLLRIAFFVLMGGILLVSVTSLLLINAMSLLGVAILAYIIGSRKLPWRLCLTAFVLFGFLHYGKDVMREKYWREEEFIAISPLQYPSFFAEWLNASRETITSGSDDQQPESLTQRASLMHLLLYIQNTTPSVLPFLYGESYKAVPVQFVPRILYPDKPRSHEGTYILSIYYNLQTREDTEITTVDIGLINEAYANFGYFGMAGLAIVLGAFFGAVSKWARHMPILSFRSLFAVLVLGSILQASSSASFYIATLYQSATVLFVLSLLFMRLRPINHARNTYLE